jgi:hypothetical protein
VISELRRILTGLLYHERCQRNFVPYSAFALFMSDFSKISTRMSDCRQITTPKYVMCLAARKNITIAHSPKDCGFLIRQALVVP